MLVFQITHTKSFRNLAGKLIALKGTCRSPELNHHVSDSPGQYERVRESYLSPELA